MSDGAMVITKEQILWETMKRTHQRILVVMKQHIASMPQGWAKQYYLHQAAVMESHLVVLLWRGDNADNVSSYLRTCRIFLRDIPYLIAYYSKHQEEQKG